MHTWRSRTSRASIEYLALAQILDGIHNTRMHRYWTHAWELFVGVVTALSLRYDDGRHQVGVVIKKYYRNFMRLA
jgi:hypothetical protein